MGRHYKKAADNSPIRIIKKYQNRKLYDTKTSCYVTLDDIARLIKTGEEVKVVDNQTKGDVTAIILTQILYDQEKYKKSIMPITMLKNMVQSGSGSVYEFMQKYVTQSVSNIHNAKVEAERYIERLVAQGELSKIEGKNLAKDLIHSAQRGVDEIQNKIDERIKTTLTKMKKVTDLQTNISHLHKKLDNIERRLDDLER